MDHHPHIEAACRLRSFQPEDLPELVRLDRRCFSPAIAFDRLEMFYHLTAPRHFSLLAVPLEGSTSPLFGFVIAAAGRRGLPGQIVTLDVNPDFRRQGIGQMLMDAAEVRLARSRNRKVRLQVAEDNVAAIRFYERAGYRPIGRRPGYYGDDTAAIEMVKRLTARGRRRNGE